jgi:TIR domain
MYDRGIFISHSAHDGIWATRVRDSIVDGINAISGYRVLIDEREFEPGDLWRPLLYRWLAQADAAVLLLSRAALESQWVRKEATILTWRRELKSDVRIIPVLLGIEMDEVRRAFPSVEIDESQAVSSTEDTNTEAARIVGAVLAGLSDLGDADDVMRGWVARVAGVLEGVPEAFLRGGAGELGLGEYEWRIDGRCLTIGHALLHSDIAMAERSLLRTVPGLTTLVGTLVGLVVPVCIPTEVAKPLLRAMQRPPANRVVVVSARYPETGPRLADRATCCDELVLKLEVQSVGVEDTEDMVFEAFVEALRDLVHLPPDEELRAEDLDNLAGPIVAFLRYSADDGMTRSVLRSVVGRVRHEFPTVTLVVLAGSEPELQRQLDVPNLIVAPTLPPDKERRGYMVAGRLLALQTRR